MKISLTRSQLGKIALLIFWGVCIFLVYWFMDVYKVSFRRIPFLVYETVDQAGPFGPLILFAGYLFLTIIPFPNAALALVAGTVYGPLYGSILVLLCLNVSSVFSFYIGRFFGRQLFPESEYGWVKKYDELMQVNGFNTVFILRILFVPFDLVSMASGMSRMTFREYFIASCLGSAPGVVTFVVLGNAFTHPRTWFFFGFILVVSLAFAVGLRHSAWAKKHVFKKPPVISQK